MGDNNYPDGEASTIDENIGQYYHEFIYPYVGSYGPGANTNRFFPALGNHDWHTSNVQPHLDYFTLPGNERYYSFTWGPLELFAIDSDTEEPDGTDSDSIQGNWLQSRLATSTATWKVVYMHHPPYSSGSHGSSTRMQWPYEEWGADVVLAGHDHDYERIIVDDFPYFVNGLGGRSFRSFEDPVEGSEVRFTGEFGAMRVDANETELTLEFITRTGQVIDSYTMMTTGGGGPNPPGVVHIPVAGGTDDAEEKATGKVSLSSSDLELVFDTGDDQTVGLRFNQIQIPRGVTINNAYVQFQVDETDSGATSLTIRGEAIDDAPSFTSSGGDITSRALTTASAAWSPPAWTTVGEAGPDQRTLDISSVIQEIVNRPGWLSGNSLAVIISGTGKRTAESYNGDPSGAPLLHVEYTINDPGVTISQSGDSTDVNEGGVSDSYTVVLDSEPTGNVDVTVTPDDQTDLGLGAGTAIILNFTPASSLVPQTVDVTALDDAVTEGAHTSAITHSASSSDTNFNGIAINDVTANITDNDTAGMTISQSGDSTDVIEGGVSDSYTVVLDSVPTGNVDVTVTPDIETDLGLGAGTAIVLTFAPGNSFSPQTVNVTAVDDVMPEGVHTSTITHSASSSDTNYEGIGISDVIATVTDNDTPGVTLSQSGGATDVSEGGFSDSYTVVLESAPTSNVDVTVTPDSQTDLGLGAGTAIVLTFSPGNAFTPQMVNVTAMDDAVVEGAHTSTITHSASSGDGDYHGFAIDDVIANIADNDTAGVTISQSGGSTDVSEAGVNDSYTVVLDTVLTSDVDVTVTPDTQMDLGLGAGTAIILNFTQGTALMPQTVNVMAVDDVVFEGAHTSTITHSTSSDDGYYIGVTISDVIANISDNDMPVITEVRVSASSDDAEERASGNVSIGSSDLELVFDSGGDQTVGMRFNGVEIPPGATIINAYVQFQVDETNSVATSLTIQGEASDDASSFATSDEDITSRIRTTASAAWSPPAWTTVGEAGPDQQTPDISSVIQEIVDRPGWSNGNSLAIIISGSGERTAESYNGDSSGAPLLHVEYTINPGVTISQSGNSTEVSEGGVSDSYTVVLDSVPTGNVDVTVRPDDRTDLGLGAGTAIILNFTPANSLAPQTVDVTAVDDAVAEGAHTSTITHSASSSDTNYNGIAINDVTANITDNDTAGVTISQSGDSTDVSEGGVSDSYTVVLETVPTANVDVTVTPNSQTDLGLGADTAIVLNFSPSNALVPQTVDVTAVDDAVAEGAHPSTITHSASSSDGNYNGIAINDVTANITNNDTAGVTISQSGSSTDMSEGGVSDSYTVVLDMVPTVNVDITVTPDSQTDLGLGAGTAIVLNFSPGNALTPQTVNVTAADDAVAEGSHTSTITHSASSSDTNYNGIAINDVTANITDDDTAGVTISQSGDSTDVSEGGLSDSYTVVLDTVPTGNVDVTVTPDSQTDLGMGAGTAIVLNFTPGTALMPQAVDDAVAEGAHTSTITHTASSSDTIYNGFAINDVIANITDNDTPMVTEVRVSASSDDAEEGATGNVKLSSSDLELVFVTGGDQTVGMRFNGIEIPPDATITNAYVQFQVDETNTVATSLTIQGEAVDDAPTFTTSAEDITSRSRTTASATWSPVVWTNVGEAGPDQRTPDIASVIQEIMDRPGWSSGNSLVVIISGTGERTAESYNGDPSGAPLLHVEYTTGGAAPLIAQGGVRIEAGLGESLTLEDLTGHVVETTARREATALDATQVGAVERRLPASGYQGATPEGNATLTSGDQAAADQLFARIGHFASTVSLAENTKPAPRLFTELGAKIGKEDVLIDEVFAGLEDSFQLLREVRQVWR